MRLIDADALKEALNDKKVVGRFNTILLIDNAPTVEYPEQITVECDTEEDKQKLLSALRNVKLKAIVEDERPQGEWIVDGHHYKCSRCGKTLAIMFSETDADDLIGCPFCLADMRGGRE